GFAVINQAYIDQTSGTFGSTNTYDLTAVDAALPNHDPVRSNVFFVNAAASFTGSPTVKITAPSGGTTVKSGDQFEVDVQLPVADSGNFNSYNVRLELRNGDTNGSLLITPPPPSVTMAVAGAGNRPDPATGLIKYMVTVAFATLPQVNTNYTLEAFLDLH